MTSLEATPAGAAPLGAPAPPAAIADSGTPVHDLPVVSAEVPGPPGTSGAPSRPKSSRLVKFGVQLNF